MDDEPLRAVRASVAGMPAYRPGKAASQAEQERGIEGAIKLASNESPWSPLPAVIDAVAAAAADANRYGDNRATALRDAVAGHVHTEPEAVTVGCGSSGLLQQVMLTFVDPGDGVVFPWPSFELYPILSLIAGADETRVDLDGLAFDLDAVAAAVTDRTKVVLLATPNNPTGTSLAMDDVAAFVARIPSHVIVVVDEAYREFNDPEMGDPVTDLVPHHPNVLVTRSFSKAFGLAGFRVGYGVGDPRLIAMLERTRLVFSVNSLAQAAALAALEHADEAMIRVDQLVSERDRVVDALTAGGHAVGPANANFVFLPVGDRTDDIALALEKDGIVTRPFPGFGIRVTIGTPDENDRWLASYARVAGGESP